MKPRLPALALLASCVLPLAAAKAADTYTLDRKVKFEAGNAQMAQGLQKIDAVRDIVTTGFQIAAEDLNGDQYPELVILATAPAQCDASGCRLVILRNTGPGQFDVLGTHRATANLGVTKQSANGYRLLAPLDAKGAIARAGQAPAVLALGASSADTAPAPVAAPSKSANDPRREMLKVKLGMSLEEVKAALRSLNPPLVPPAMADTKTIVPLLPNGAFVASYYAPQSGGTQGSTFKTATVEFSPPPLPSRAVAISQTVNYGANEGPTLDNLLAAMKEKYGDPHQKRDLARGMAKLYWAWAPDGTPLQGEQFRRCGEVGSSLAFGQRTNLYRSPDILNAASSLLDLSRKANCGMYAYADYSSSANGIVVSMNLLVADVETANVALAKTVDGVERLLHEQQNKQRKEAQERRPEL